MKLLKHLSNKALFYYTLILFSGSIFGQNTTIKNITLKYDAGPLEASIKETYTQLSKYDNYNKDKGYGWTISPTHSFIKHEYSTNTLRDDLTIDGLTGKEVEFKADISPGDWWFTFWLEAGNDYKNSAKLFLNDKERTINWHPLLHGEGGKDVSMPVYRVYQTKINIDNNGFKYRLVGGKDSIRVCGFSLIPDSKPKNNEHFRVEKLLKEAGKYRSKTSLNDIEKYLSRLSIEYPFDSYFVYWHQQVSILNEGERIYEMQGWEWARDLTRLSIFARLKQAITLFDGILENNNSIDSPLYEKALWLRAKLFYSLFHERGGTEKEIAAKRDFKILFDKYPEDPILAMYNGVKVDLKDPADNMKYYENAPRWSILQRELYNRLSNEIDWWVNQRQAGNGEFGGKLGDDVELLRWWSSFLLTGNETAIRGWRKLADAVWESPKLHKGYSKRVLDVEHASEFISDSTPELILIDDDSTYFKRLKYTADYFENLWTSKNSKGHRYFKSSWYSSSSVDESPPRNIDVDYNARAVKPLRYLAWATRDENFIRLLHEWSLAWVNAAMRTDKNKPKGLLPASIRGYDESFNGDGKTWYFADSYWNYFNWDHSVGSGILDNILFTYTLTGDKNLLSPFSFTMEMIREFILQYPNYEEDEFQEGTKGWAVKIMISKYSFWNVMEKWKIFTNESKYDDLLIKYGNDYTKYKLSGDIKYLEENMENSLQNIRFNTPLRTSLVLHTDRVRTPGANTLKAMLTGDGTPESSSPYYAVTWEKTNRDFTTLVKDFSSTSLTSELFSHYTDDYEITIRFWLLKKGEYSFRITDLDNKELLNQKFLYESPGERVSFILPKSKLITLQVTGIL